ncbi:MAG: hypothetical protein ACLUTA_00500 [Blautia wexlerae]
MKNKELLMLLACSKLRYPVSMTACQLSEAAMTDDTSVVPVAPTQANQGTRSSSCQLRHRQMHRIQPIPITRTKQYQ